MKKIIFTLCALSLGSVVGISQNITYKIGPEYEPTVQHKDYGYFLAANNTPVNVSIFKASDFSIQPIDLNTLNVSTGYTHDISSFAKDASLEKIINLKDNLFYVYSTLDKKTERRTVHARLIDDQNKIVKNKSAVVFESEEPASAYLTPFVLTRYHFNLSRNKEYALISCRFRAKEKKAKLNKDVIGFSVIDKDLNVKFNKLVEMPYFENLMEVKDFHADSKGNVFMLIRVFDEQYLGKYTYMLEHSKYELVKVNGNGGMEKKELNMGDKYLQNFLLTDDLDGNVVVVGFYSNSEKTNSKANGMYIFKYGTNGESKSVINFYEFSLDVFKSYENETTQEKLEDGGRIDAALYLDDVFFHPNGDILIVNEQYKAKTNEKGNVSKNYFLDIIALKVDKNGKLIWTKKIPKNQTGAGRSDLSYKYHYNNGNDYFLFIDNENNLNLKIDEAPKAHICRLGGYLVAVKLDANGNMQKFPIFDLRNETISVFPVDFFKVNDNTLIGKCFRDRKKVLIKIDFK